MTSPAFIPVRWSRPNSRVLSAEVFPRSRPPFDPFPTATLIAKGYCPVAIYWHFLWGRTPIGVEDSDIRGVGVHYHQALGRFRYLVSRGAIDVRGDAGIPVIEAVARGFLRDYQDHVRLPIATYEELTRLFLAYVRRKAQQGEIQSLRHQTLLIEPVVINPYCEFRFGNQAHRYPLRAQIDEVNLTTRTVIERTTDPRLPNNRPPGQKFTQAWLGAHALAQVGPSQRPPDWENLWNGPIRVLVETPEADFEIDPAEEPTYHYQAIYAYTWLRDLYRGSGRVAASPWDERACTLENPREECPHCFLDCYHRVRRYPQSRPGARASLRRYSRPLLYDQLWQVDLAYYRLTMLSEQDLFNQEQLFRGTIVDASDDRIVVELGLETIRTRLRARQIRAVVSGNLQAGLHIAVNVERIEERPDGIRLTLQLGAGYRGLPVYRGTLLLYLGDVTDLYEEPIEWLNQRTRSDLLWSMRVGVDNEDVAAASAFNQLMEASFGTLPLQTYLETAVEE